MTAGPLAAERAWLDACLERDLRAQRAVHALSVEEFQGLFVGDDLVTAYLGEREPGEPLVPPCPAGEALGRLAARFGLSETERALLVLAAAAEIDGKYEPIFAYLNGAASRRWPTWGLACRLFGGPAHVLPLLGPQGRLARGNLIAPAIVDPSRPAMAQEFRTSRAVTHRLLGLRATLPAGAEWLPAVAGECSRLDPCAEAGDRAAIVLLTGRGDCGRTEALQALAFRTGRPLLRARLDFRDAALSDTFAEIALAAALDDALLLVEGEEPEGRDAPAIMREAAAILAHAQGPIFVCCDPGSILWQVVEHGRALTLSFDPPRPSERARLWHRALAAAAIEVDPSTVGDLAARFRLGPARIAEAVGAVALRAAIVPTSAAPRAALFEAARDLSGHELARLARRVPATHALIDLVLPDDALERIRAVVNAIRHMDLVHGEWGLRADGRSAGGLAVLFQGPSGTGKTMTASIAAAEAGLDLYRIDLSSIVSKYIGETEKNLEAIFRAARDASAVLMFDEADAIFGRRSEVKDAHDRYANIETAYLLQRIEEHEGAVILATNLARNIDQAFSRRLAYVVEFPRPTAAGRVLLWRRMLAPPVPVAGDVDCEALGQAFELTGGDIRKAALEAAYLAAGDGGIVRMAHLVASGLRETRRQGRMTSSADLRALQAVA